MITTKSVPCMIMFTKNTVLKSDMKQNRAVMTLIKTHFVNPTFQFKVMLQSTSFILPRNILEQRAMPKILITYLNCLIDFTNSTISSSCIKY